MHNGWYQIAYERSLVDGLNEVQIDEARLAIVRHGEFLAVIDAFCPHRGANLCYGGRLVEKAVICAFHGYRISLNDEGPFRAKILDALVVGGLVFAKLPGGPDHGLSARLRSLDETHYFVPGFEKAVEAPATLVVENAFDAEHFRPVHGILNRPEMAANKTASGTFQISGVFRLPTSVWQKTKAEAEAVTVPFQATAFSPTIVLSELGGDRPYMMLTATQPLAPRHAIVRLSLIIPAGSDQEAPPSEECAYLLEQAKRGIDQDEVIWANMAWPPRHQPAKTDAPIMAFQRFCEGFGRS